MSLPSHPDLLAEKLQIRSILTLHLVSFQGVRSEQLRVRRRIPLAILVAAISALPACSQSGSSSEPNEIRVTLNVFVVGSGSGQIDASEIELSCTVTSGASIPVSCFKTFRDPNGVGSFTLTARPSPGSVLSGLVAKTLATDASATCAGQVCDLGFNSPGGEVLFEVDVRFSPAPAQVQITPSSATITLGGTVQLAAQALDALGAPLSGHTFTWTSSDDSVAIVVSATSGDAATLSANLGETRNE